MKTLESNEKMQPIIGDKINDDVATKGNSTVNSPGKDSVKKLLDSFVGHVTEIFKKFTNTDGTLKSPENKEFIDLGRDEQERKQIEEFCQDIDEQNRLLVELQEFKAQDPNHTAQDWLKLKGEAELADCSSEERETILQFINEQQESDIEGQTEALENILEKAIEEQNNSNIIKEDGKDGRE